MARAKGKPRKRGVKLCPRCGSAEIFWARGLAQLWSVWECKNCGYYGAFIIEDGKISKKLQEVYAKKHPSRSKAEA
jgi:DNA-directed RNA polymerase subunit M